MKKPLEIENHEDLTAYLRETGRVGSKELLQIHTLAGGVSNRTLVLGDDLLCTNPQRIARATETQACNALLLKVNQIGTLSEALQAYRLARDAGWRVVISVRSGDTEDDWFSDLAVGWSGDQTKAGSLTQSERLAKYNRLLEIEAQVPVAVVDWPHGAGQYA